MKSIIFLTTLSLAFLIASGCKKKVMDSRKKYIGTWEMTILNEGTTYSTDMGGNSVTEHYSNTIVQDVDITMDETTEDGLILHFSSGTKEISLTSNGKFEKKCNAPLTTVITGSFQSKHEMTMVMSNWGHCNSYSAGGHSNQTISGVKK